MSACDSIILQGILDSRGYRLRNAPKWQAALPFPGRFLICPVLRVYREVGEMFPSGFLPPSIQVYGIETKKTQDGAYMKIRFRGSFCDVIFWKNHI